LVSVKEVVVGLLNELKAALKAYLHDTEVAFKKRVRKLLLVSITGMVLLAVAITFLGSAALFLLIGQYKYLRQTLPAWLAWDIMGLVAILIGGLFLLGLYLIIRKQLKTDEPKIAGKA
jgi:hypothetical protein